MAPTYPPGSRVWASRWSYLFTAPARGDVVVIQSPQASPRRIELKRIIGLPHEQVSWGQGRFCVNGVPLDEPYARIPSTPPGDDAMSTAQLGSREYFVAGDNRLYSRDSRHDGPVARCAILGKILSYR